MNCSSKSFALVIAAALAAGPLALASEEEGPEEVELVGYMSTLQYFTHKLGLSITAENKDLAGFYLHELEELVEVIEDEVPSYDGYPIADLIRTLLAPAVENVEKAVQKGGWESADGAFDDLLTACNRCHTETKHGFIRIERRSDNPFIQSFKPTP